MEITKYKLPLPDGTEIKKSKKGRWIFIKDFNNYICNLNKEIKAYKKENKKLVKYCEQWKQNYLNFQANVYSMINDRVSNREKEIRDSQVQIKKVLLVEMVEFVITNHINEMILVSNNKKVETAYLLLKDVEELIRIVTGTKPDIKLIMWERFNKENKDKFNCSETTDNHGINT